MLLVAASTAIFLLRLLHHIWFEIVPYALVDLSEALLFEVEGVSGDFLS